MLGHKSDKDGASIIGSKVSLTSIARHRSSPAPESSEFLRVEPGQETAVG